MKSLSLVPLASVMALTCLREVEGLGKAEREREKGGDEEGGGRKKRGRMKQGKRGRDLQ